MFGHRQLVAMITQGVTGCSAVNRVSNSNVTGGQSARAGVVVVMPLNYNGIRRLKGQKLCKTDCSKSRRSCRSCLVRPRVVRIAIASRVEVEGGGRGSV